MTRSHTLSLIDGPGGAALLRQHVAPRLRPGEYPVWCELELSSNDRDSLRQRARQNGVGADAFVSLALEYRQLAEAVGQRALTGLVEVAVRERARPAIGMAPELRAWQRLLEGRTEPADDELPSICVPLRLLSQIPVPLRIEALSAAATIEDGDATAAIALEVVAARRGMTMVYWALSQRG